MMPCLWKLGHSGHGFLPFRPAVAETQWRVFKWGWGRKKRKVDLKKRRLNKKIGLFKKWGSSQMIFHKIYKSGFGKKLILCTKSGLMPVHNITPDIAHEITRILYTKSRKPLKYKEKLEKRLAIADMLAMLMHDRADVGLVDQPTTFERVGHGKQNRHH